MTLRRLFVCDPMCVLPFGHNVSSLVYYRSYLSSRFDGVILVGAQQLDEALAKDKKIHRFFHYYYDAFVPLSKDTFSRKQRPRSETDDIRPLSLFDSDKLFRDFHIAESDSIFFPSADFYGVSALLAHISGLHRTKAPRIYLRFIGVMENASQYEAQPLAEVLVKTKHLLESGYDIRISAETPSYADYLAERLKQCVHVTPYPETGAPLPLAEKDPFIVFAPGSARHDKGFFRLFEIFAEVRRRHAKLDLQFVTQVLPDNEIQYQRRYVAQLYALPGVRLLPASISDTIMQDTFKRAHVVILPYDPDIYRYRGSAVTFEAISAGRPIISEPGTGFAKQIDYYGLGYLCGSLSDYADAIIQCYNTPLENLSARSTQARTRFLVDTNAAYQAWMR